MSLRIGFFQYELSHPNNPPHVGQCLLLEDLRRAGHEVDAMLVHVAEADRMIETIERRGYDLVAIDAIFTKPVVERMKAACPDVPMIVGGNNALPLFLAAPLDYAIAGPGRRAMRAFVSALESGELPVASTNGDAPVTVPNLWLRDGNGNIDYSGMTEPWSFEPELDPYEPDLAWDYLGPERDPSANLRFASVVPEWGCAFQEDSMTSPAFARLTAGTPSRRVESLPLTARARAAVEPYFANTRGCAFCTFRYQPYTIDATGSTVDRLVGQLSNLHARYGIREFSVQSEHPFRFLRPLLVRHRADPLPVDTLLLRTFPAVLSRNPDRIIADVADAVDAGIRIQIQQLGFENFVQDELDRLGKGIRVEENLAAVQVLHELSRRFGDAVEVFQGHGFILFTPWTTPEDVAENIRVIRREAPFLESSIGLSSRLCFYDPFNPIFRLAELDDLVVDVSHDYGMDFRFAEERTRMLARLALAVEGTLVQRGTAPGPPVSRAALESSVALLTDGTERAADALFEAALSGARGRLT